MISLFSSDAELEDSEENVPQYSSSNCAREIKNILDRNSEG